MGPEFSPRENAAFGRRDGKCRILFASGVIRSAEGAAQQSPGRKPWEQHARNKPCKGGAAAVPPLQG